MSKKNRLRDEGVPKARIPVSKGYQVPFARNTRDEAGIMTGQSD
jgi:hypothetical protein